MLVLCTYYCYWASNHSYNCTLFCPAKLRAARPPTPSTCLALSASGSTSSLSLSHCGGACVSFFRRRALPPCARSSPPPPALVPAPPPRPPARAPGPPLPPPAQVLGHCCKNHSLFREFLRLLSCRAQQLSLSVPAVPVRSSLARWTRSLHQQQLG